MPQNEAAVLWTSTQLLTAAAPTLVTEGLSLDSIDGFRVILSAPSGQTLAGAGTLKAYYWDTTYEEWVRNPDLDIEVTSSHASVRRVVFADQAVFAPVGRLYYAASAVTVSSGTTVDIRIVGVNQW